MQRPRAVNVHTASPRTIEAALLWARWILSPVTDTAACDAEILLGYTVNKDRAWLFTHTSDPFAPGDFDRFAKLIKRRIDGEPVAYITGTRAFWSLELCVTPETLIPRPETELLVEHALFRIPLDAEWDIADLGTGCGAIALAIAAERLRCRVTATDVSPAALVVARKNRSRLALYNVNIRQGHWFTPLVSQRFHVIVANPPYVAEGDPHLHSGDLAFEPDMALRAGAEGLDALRVIIRQAARHLEPDGWLLVEHGCTQGQAVQQLMEHYAGRNISLLKDHASLDRISICQFTT